MLYVQQNCNAFTFNTLNKYRSSSISTITASAQTSSNSTKNSGSMINADAEKQINKSKDQNGKDSNEKQQIEICKLGAGGPCNGDSNWDGRDDRTGKWVLSKGCATGGNNNVTQNKAAHMTSNSSLNSSVFVDGSMAR